MHTPYIRGGPDSTIFAYRNIFICHSILRFTHRTLHSSSLQMICGQLTHTIWPLVCTERPPQSIEKYATPSVGAVCAPEDQLLVMGGRKDFNLWGAGSDGCAECVLHAKVRVSSCLGKSEISDHSFFLTKTLLLLVQPLPV
jgi:hypothetical protein